MPETKSETSSTTHIATVSGRIIAAVIIIACINYASSIVITLICAILIAFVLEPAVHLLERIHVPRWLGASCWGVLIGLMAGLPPAQAMDTLLTLVRRTKSNAELLASLG